VLFWPSTVCLAVPGISWCKDLAVEILGMQIYKVVSHWTPSVFLYRCGPVKIYYFVGEQEENGWINEKSANNNRL